MVDWKKLYRVDQTFWGWFSDYRGVVWSRCNMLGTCCNKYSLTGHYHPIIQESLSSCNLDKKKIKTHGLCTLKASRNTWVCLSRSYFLNHFPWLNNGHLYCRGFPQFCVIQYPPACVSPSVYLSTSACLARWSTPWYTKGNNIAGYYG